MTMPGMHVLSLLVTMCLLGPVGVFAAERTVRVVRTADIDEVLSVLRADTEIRFEVAPNHGDEVGKNNNKN